MSDCPRCGQTVDAQAIACPYCRTPLKAYGHPGVPLYRAEQGKSLCDTCTYHEDDTCNFPQRPYAQECTMYHDRTQPRVIPTYKPSGRAALQLWVRRNSGWLAVLALIGISVAIALSRR